MARLGSRLFAFCNFTMQRYKKKRTLPNILRKNIPKAYFFVYIILRNASNKTAVYQLVTKNIDKK